NSDPFWTDLAGSNDPKDRSDLAAGFYVLVIRDANGCESQVSNLQVMDDCQSSTCVEPVVLNIITQSASCDNADGSIEVDLVGDESDYTYAWSGGVSSGPLADNLAGGMYSVTVSRANDPDCFTVVQAILDNADGPQAQIGSLAPSACNTNSGSASLLPDNFVYNWCNGATGNVQTGLAAGSCMVTVTDPATGCSNLIEVVIAELNLTRTEATIEEAADCGASNGQASIRVFGGSGDYNYLWSDGGSGRVRTDLVAGTYEVTVVDINAPGCEVELLFVMTEKAAAGAFVTFDNPSKLYFLDCSGDRNGEAGFTPGFETGFVQPARIEIVDANGQQQSNGQLAPGEYCVLIYDGNDCLAGQDCFEVREPQALSVRLAISDKDCVNGGEIDLFVLGGTRPYNYDWADLAGTDDPADRSDLEAGLYSLTLTDANGCQVELSGLQVEDNCTNSCVLPEVLNIVTTQTSCDRSDGSIRIQLAGNPSDYTYTWTDNVSNLEIADDLAAGIYSVTITANNDPNCSIVEEIAIGSADGPRAEIISVTPTSCNLSIGTAVLAPTTFAYEWCDGSTGFTKNDLPAGTCIVRVVNPATSCESFLVVEVPEINNLSVTPQINAQPDCGQANGSVFIGVTGGSTSYSYVWSDNGSGNPSRDNLAAGTYSVTVTDQGQTGCQFVTTFTLSDQLPAIANVVINHPGDSLSVSCHDASDAVLDFEVSLETGFVQPADVAIVDVQGNRYDPAALGAGRYCVLVRDGNGCVASEACFVVTEPDPIAVDVAVIAAECVEKGSILVEARGGQGNFLFDWADLAGANNPSSRNDLSAGSYDLTVTDAGRCPIVLDAIMVADSCPICPFPDTLSMVVVVFEQETSCVRIEDCFDASQTSFELIDGGNNASSAFGEWSLGIDGCLTYRAGSREGSGVDTICVVASFDNLRDTTCFIIDILPERLPTLETDTIYLTTLEGLLVDTCLTTAALPADFDEARLVYDPVNSTGTFGVTAQDSCVSYLPNAGQTGNFIDTMSVALCDVNNVCDTFVIIVSVEPNDCPPLLDSNFVSLVSFDCAAGAEYCLGIELAQVGDFEITLDGRLYDNGFDFCNTDTLLEAALSSLFNQIPNGPYQLVNWTVNGDTFELTSFMDVAELVDSMNVWDPAGNWVLDNDVIRGDNSGNVYTDLIIKALNLPVTVPVAIRPILISQGAQIQVDTGRHVLIVNELATACRDTLILEVDCIDCPGFYSGPDTLDLMDCDSTVQICLDLDLTDLRRYTISDNGQEYDGTIFGCDFDTLQVYDLTPIQGPGVYALDQWVVDSDTLRLPVFSTPQDLLSEIIGFDPAGNWRLIGNFLQGGNPGSTYGPLVVVINGTTTPINARPLRIPNGAAIALDQGAHEVVVQDTISGCREIIDVFVNCNQIGQGADTLLVIPVGDKDTFCIDLTNFNEIPTIRNVCPNSSNGNALFDIQTTEACVEFDAQLLGLDTFCLEVCDAMGMCDTLNVIVQVVPKMTVITDTLFLAQTDTICLDTLIFQGNIDTIFNDCPGLSGSQVSFEPLDGTKNCVLVEALDIGRDSACMVICDDLGNCATTILIYDVIYPQIDTIRETVLLDESGVYCIDTSELSTQVDTVFNDCPGGSGVFVEYVIENDSLCVRFTGL
ncbi:MAG: hypothetical protein AAFV25_13220, partial [Bacteroidota bacterium]